MTRSTHRGAAHLFTAMVVSAALVSGCVGSSQSETTPSVAAPPSPDPFTSALIMSRSWASAQMEATVLSDIDGERQAMHAVGEVGIDKGYATLEWTGGDTHSHEIVNDRGTYRQDVSPRGLWTYYPPGTATTTSPLADPLRHLSQARDVTRAGTDTMDGFEATRYRGTLPITTDTLAGLALTDAQIGVIIESAGPDESVDLTMWLDPNRRLVRIDRSLDLDGPKPLSVVASTHLWNFGIMLHVEPPPSVFVVATASALPAQNR